MLNSIKNIVSMHRNKGNIEDAYIDVSLGEKVLKLNIYTLKFEKENLENDLLNFEIKRDINLVKEIKEFRVLFEALEKLKIKKGYIEKTERPDFIMQLENKKIGIEITKIYSGNDWVPEKIYEDIKMYNLNNKDALKYIQYKKYTNKIVTYVLKENLVIKPLNKIEDTHILKVKTKNKIFEKVRKMFDEYNNYDMNIILANIVNPKYFDSVENIEKFNDELRFFINHLEANNQNREYAIIMKLDKNWIKFNLNNFTYEIL